MPARPAPKRHAETIWYTYTVILKSKAGGRRRREKIKSKTADLAAFANDLRNNSPGDIIVSVTYEG